MKITIIIYSNDSETVWNAFRFAAASLGYDNEVTVFLLGRGIEMPGISTLEFDIEEQVDLFRENGGRLIGCGVCCDIRGETMPNLKAQLQCEIGSMQQMYEIVASADRVLTF